MSGEDEQQEQTIAEDLVVTKYKMGGDIANRECDLRGPDIEGGKGESKETVMGWLLRAGAVGSRTVGY